MKQTGSYLIKIPGIYLKILYSIIIIIDVLNILFFIIGIYFLYIKQLIVIVYSLRQVCIFKYKLSNKSLQSQQEL